MKRCLVLLLSCIFIFPKTSTSQTAVDFESRRNLYIDLALSAPSGNRLMLEAYRGQALSQSVLDSMLNNLVQKTTADFDIVQLVRILYLNPGVYDSVILPVLFDIPFWLNNGDTTRNYWSENHMIMWMGSDWLLHERYNKPIDIHLENRLKHYLDVKLNYGFYEFFSSTYLPFEFSGLVNLAEFALNQEIKDKAYLACRKVLAELLLATQDNGVFYPAAGRNYTGKYSEPYNQSHYNLIYMLSGLGTGPVQNTHGGMFLATCNLPFWDLINERQPTVDTLLQIGHPLAQSYEMHNTMSFVDRTIFHWSFGGYFHPDFAGNTVTILNDSNLWNQVDFEMINPLQLLLTPDNAADVSENLNVISKSSVLCEANIAMFRNGNISLNSVQDFWKGKVGFQQFPVVASVGTSALFTASGEVTNDWENRNDKNVNTHLPYVQQSGNTALVMYRPEVRNAALPSYFFDLDVSLHFFADEFDEVDTAGNWIFARQGENFGAIRRPCLIDSGGIYFCPMVQDEGQTWIYKVGNETLYGSYINFKNTCISSQFTETWALDTINSTYDYGASFTSEGQTISHVWKRDTLLGTHIINNAFDEEQKFFFPNPASEYVNYNGNPQDLQLVQVFDLKGKLCYQFTKPTARIAVSGLTAGIYLLKVQLSDGKWINRKLAIQ